MISILVIHSRKEKREHNHNLSAQTENQIVHLRHCTDGTRPPAFGRHAARILSAAGYAACLRGLLCVHERPRGQVRRARIHAEAHRRD